MQFRQTGRRVGLAPRQLPWNSHGRQKKTPARRMQPRTPSVVANTISCLSEQHQTPPQQTHSCQDPRICTGGGSTRPRIASPHSCQPPSGLCPSCAHCPSFNAPVATGRRKAAQRLGLLRTGPRREHTHTHTHTHTHLPHLAHLRHGFFLGAGPSSPSSPSLRLLAGTSWASASNSCAGPWCVKSLTTAYCCDML